MPELAPPDVSSAAPPRVAAPAAGMVRILGIDPGSRCTGIGIIDVAPGGQLRHVHHAALRVAGDSGEGFALRLKRILDGLGAVIAEFTPQEAAIERVFMARNPDSALKLGQARGAALCAVVQRDLPVSEYAAREVKQAVVGTGAGDKAQVQYMMALLLGLTGRVQADAADALAIAITHAHARSSLARAGVPRGSWRRRR